MAVRDRRRFWLGACALLIVAAAYSRVLDAGFVYDDETYLLKNAHLSEGLNWEALRWSLTSIYAANWHPLTWLSHLADTSLFGLRPRGHHGVNLLLHLTNTLLLWRLVRDMTGAAGRSAVIAGLFALHPLHVESVAWVAERKDLLCALFFLLGLAAYRRYVARPSPGRFVRVALFLALALASKPMAVTFPFVLLLLDWWPLGRVQVRSRRLAVGLVREKIPLFLLVGAAATVTLYAQIVSGAAMSLTKYPLPERIAGAAVSYLRYLDMMVWPARLAVFYPHPGRYAAGAALGAFAALSGITCLALWAARRRPWVATGWFWYLGMLVPVIGLVQVGSQAMADRYTYLPLTGIFMVAVWAGADALTGRPWRAAAQVAVPGALLLVLATLTWRQTAYWRDQRTLFGHAAAVTGPNWVAENNLGVVAANAGRGAEAIVRFGEAIRLEPTAIDAYINLGSALVSRGDYAGAIAAYRTAIGFKPLDPRAHINLGTVLEAAGRRAEAIAEYREVVRIAPDLATGYMNLGNALSELGRNQEALAWNEQAVRLAPGDADAHYNYGLTLQNLGRVEESGAQYREALRLRADHGPAREALERLGGVRR